MTLTPILSAALALGLAVPHPRPRAGTGRLEVFAGSPGGSGSRDGAGTAARFWAPGGAAVDRSGRVWVADTNNHTLRRIDPSGRVVTIAGRPGESGSADGPAAKARFCRPTALAFDPAGNLLIADTGNHTLRRLGPDGRVLTLAGRAEAPGAADGPGSEARFDHPCALAVDRAGQAYVCESGRCTIRKVTPAGRVTTWAGGERGSLDGPLATARFGPLLAIAADPAGAVYVIESAIRIRRIAADGTVTTLAGPAFPADMPSGGVSPWLMTSLAVGPAGGLLVAGDAALRRVAPDGTVTVLAGAPGQRGSVDGAGPAIRLDPTDLAVAPDGRVVLIEGGRNVVRTWTPETGARTLAGLPGSLAAADGMGPAARLRSPACLALDTAGNALVAEGEALRQVAPSGQVTTLAGGPGRDDLFPDGRQPTFSSATVDGDGYWLLLDAQAGPGQPNLLVRTPTGALIRRSLPPATGEDPGRGGFAPLRLAAGPAGTLYLASETEIRTVAADGSCRPLAGGPEPGAIDGTGAEARFQSIAGLVRDPAGNLLVADGHAIRRVSPAGRVTTLAGAVQASGFADGRGAAARFRLPGALALDPAGTLYVLDAYNQAVRSVTPDGRVTTLAGRPDPQGLRLGPLPAARLGHYLWGLALTPSGDLLVGMDRCLVRIVRPRR